MHWSLCKICNKWPNLHIQEIWQMFTICGIFNYLKWMDYLPSCFFVRSRVPVGFWVTEKKDKVK